MLIRAAAVTVLFFFLSAVSPALYGGCGDRELDACVIQFCFDLYRLRKEAFFLKNALYFSEIKNAYIHEPVMAKNETPGRFQDFDISAIQEALGPGQRIIKYTVLDDHTYVFCISRRSIDFHRLKIPTCQLTGMVRRLTEPLDDFTRGKVDYLHIHYNLPLAHRLYKVLLEDILQVGECREGEEIFIIPDRELFKLPFEALVTGFNQRAAALDIIFSEYASADYLLEKHPVSYWLSLFHLLETAAPARGKKYRYAVTAFGNPVIERDRAGGNMRLFRDIPSAGKEIESIQAIFAGENKRVFVRENFTRSMFEAYAGQSRVVHIATHFVNDIHCPQYSALLFSPAGAGGGGAFFYAHELLKLTLDAELVVLSACESSEKHLLGFQGMRGMTASFRHAGVRAMVVSMWPVDEHSSALIPLFYEGYKNRQNSRLDGVSRALQAARSKLMKKVIVLDNGLKISYAHPFIWANYIVYHFRH
jgi:CHAT domain-containing protein